MKKLYYLIVLVLILGLVLTGCSLLSNVGQVPTTGQSGISYLTKAGTETDPELFPLYARQDWLVGEVLVWDDGTRLCVKYQLFSEIFDEGDGWGITETHLAVATSLEGIPTNKSGNPQPGKFPYVTDELGGVEETEPYCIPFEDIIGFAEGESLCGTDIVIAAHAVIEKTECGDLTEAPYGGFQVVNSLQGLLYGYTDIKEKRSDPDAVLTFEIGHDESFFFSLGFQEDRSEYLSADDAWIIVEFDIPIQNGPGDDLQVIEDTWGLPYPYETADVWVSQNGTDSDWTYLGEADNQNPISGSGYHTITDFDLDDTGLDWVKYVKVQDTSNRADFAGNFQADGYDLNAIVALQDYQECTTYSETAWAANDEIEGDVEGTIQFIDSKSWATYFEYTIYCPPVLIETIPIDPIVPTGATSSAILDDGVEYEFVVSGTWGNRPGERVDAKYCSDDDWVTPGTEAPSGVGLPDDLLELFVDGAGVNWGAYSDTHTYSIYFIGTGSTVHFSINDSYYPDNLNSDMQVEIWTK